MIKRRGDLITGVIIIIVGLIFLAKNYDFMPDIFDIGRLWPIFVIIGGLWVILDAKSRSGKEDKDRQ